MVVECVVECKNGNSLHLWVVAQLIVCVCGVDSKEQRDTEREREREARTTCSQTERVLETGQQLLAICFSCSAAFTVGKKNPSFDIIRQFLGLQVLLIASYAITGHY